MLHGILLVDKEPGWTSHDVVAKARGLTGQRKIGHTGTLDPAATGLLVLCLGDATRLVEYMSGHEKCYTGTIRLGVRTETDDAEGAVIERCDVPPQAEVDLQALTARFTGEIAQRPPAYSAISVAGQRAYAVARRGGSIDLPERSVAVRELRLRWAGPAELEVVLRCSAGTYVRSLARDIGAALGCGAHLATLRRTAAGHFRVTEAVTIGDLADAAGRGAAGDLLLPADEGVTDADAAIVTGDHATMLGQGKRLPPAARISREGLLRVYSTAGQFVGIGSADGEGWIRPLKVLQGAQAVRQAYHRYARHAPG